MEQEPMVVVVIDDEPDVTGMVRRSMASHACTRSSGE